jgi:plasmid stabilization system protein ParE
MRVRYTSRASGDLEAILQYLSQSPLGMRNLKRAVENTERLIGQYPQDGHMSKESGARVRPAGRYPYLIYWTIEDNEARIVHIRDGRRKPWRGEP